MQSWRQRTVDDTKINSRLTISRPVENVAIVQEMSDRSLQKPIHQTARESGLTRHRIRMLLHKELNFRPSRRYYVCKS